MRECKINTKGVGCSLHEWPDKKAGVSGMSSGMRKTKSSRNEKEGEPQLLDSTNIFW